MGEVILGFWQALTMPSTGSLRFGGLGQIHVAFGDVQVNAGSGTHRLVFPAQVTATWLDPDGPPGGPPPSDAALITGTVWTEIQGHRWLADMAPQVIATRGYVLGEEFWIDLSSDQVIELERGRGESDLRLTLKVTATLLQPKIGTHPLAQEQIAVNVTPAIWLGLLDHLGTEVGIILRVPSPLTDSALNRPSAASNEDAASLTQATARLRQARTELKDHQWEHCVATCRKVLENIARLVAIPPAERAFRMPPDSRSQPERWAAIYHEVKRMTHPAHHDGESNDDFAWDRASAETILAMTASLLLRYSQP
jgi:hypothetical protein